MRRGHLTQAWRGFTFGVLRSTFLHMRVITKITEQKRRPNRRNIFLEGVFAFACNQNVVRKFSLQAGMALDDAQIQQVLAGEVQQECFDRAMGFLERRMHSRAELERKLTRHEYGPQAIGLVLEKLVKLGYLDDAEFARQKIQQMQRRLHGRRSAMSQLIKAGVKSEMARETMASEYPKDDVLAAAKELIAKHQLRLRSLDPVTAKRRLLGLLQRRGFDYELIKPLVDRALRADEESA
jgi:regulatory protein